MVEVTLPSEFEDKTATLLNWLVEVGDFVSEGQDLIEVETEKIALTVPSPLSGRVSKLLAEESQELRPGDAILEIEEAAIADSARETFRHEPPVWYHSDSNERTTGSQGQGEPASGRFPPRQEHPRPQITDSQELRELIENLRKRATSARWKATASLVLIVGLLVMGGAIFVEAGSIAAGELAITGD